PGSRARAAQPRPRRARGSRSPRSPAGLAERVEDDGIDRVVAVHPFLEVLDACPGIERVVAEPGEALVDLRAQLALERQPVLARAQPEQAVVELVDATQLLDRPLVVV